MARPKKQTGDKRAQLVQARVSPAEHADILLRAAQASLSPSEFLRRSALSAEVVVQAEQASDFETGSISISSPAWPTRPATCQTALRKRWPRWINFSTG